MWWRHYRARWYKAPNEGNAYAVNLELARHLLRARDLADARYADSLDIAALAARAHVSPTHFTRMFRAAYGATPHQYLIARRMERAALLLRETDRPVTEVSLDVGFRSLGSFSTTFRRWLGVTPSEYRAGSQPSRVPSCMRTVVFEKRA
jgi:AraC-like DNA-binding protein